MCKLPLNENVVPAKPVKILTELRGRIYEYEDILELLKSMKQTKQVRDLVAEIESRYNLTK